MDQGTNQQRQMTEERETMDEMYERLRIASLPEPLQRLVIQHHLDQFEAMPSYVEQQAAKFASEGK
jgi:hypothetical protein